MKVKTQVGFKPVEMNVTFESLDELQAAWHIFNVSAKSVRENASGNSKAPPIPDNVAIFDVAGKLWNAVHATLKPRED